MTQINFRIDEDTKANAEAALKEMGLNMSSAITMFLTKVAREKRIPFEVNADPFYSKDNFNRLSKAVEDVNTGRNMSEHELIEVDD